MHAMVVERRCMFEYIANNGEWDIGVSELVGVWLSKKCVAWKFAEEDL